MKEIALQSLVSFLDRELRVSDYRDDSSANGLQVEGRGTVRKIGLAVDASDEAFMDAAARNIDFLLVHHGMIWGGIRSVSGIMKQRISTLLKHGISLYASHLPLDGHPTLGNNARILRMLGIKKLLPFGEYHGSTIGFRGSLPLKIPLSRFERDVARIFSAPVTSHAFGKGVQNVGVISGGGWFGINDAEKAGIDTFLTGEPSHSAYHLAKEMKINLVFAGHYATEVPGVMAAGNLLRRKFGLSTVFLDHPTGL